MTYDNLFKMAEAYNLDDEYVDGLIKDCQLNFGQLFQTKYKCEFNKSNKKDMGIVKFAKDLALNKDEKALREVCLKDDCGDYTSEARELVMEKLLEDNKDYLLEVAKKKIALDKKK